LFNKPELFAQNL